MLEFSELLSRPNFLWSHGRLENGLGTQKLVKLRTKLTLFPDLIQFFSHRTILLFVLSHNQNQMYQMEVLYLNKLKKKDVSQCYYLWRGLPYVYVLCCNLLAYKAGVSQPSSYECHFFLQEIPLISRERVDSMSLPV